MTIRTALSLAAAAGLALAAACSPQAQTKAEADAHAVGYDVNTAAEKAAPVIREEAGQIGDAIQAGAGEAAQEVDEATDALQRKADQQKAETAADHTGNTTAPAH